MREARKPSKETGKEWSEKGKFREGMEPRASRISGMEGGQRESDVAVKLRRRELSILFGNVMRKSLIFYI